MELDDETRRIMKELGVNVDEADFDGAARKLGLGNGQSLRQMRNALAQAAVAGDTWDEEVKVLDLPFQAAIPVLVHNDPLVVDPMVFTLILGEPPSPEQVDAISVGVASIASAETSDDDDHVSSWSEVQVATMPTAEPAIRWHLDVAAARPQTIRRVIQASADLAAGAISPLPRRLVVGGED